MNKLQKLLLQTNVCLFLIVHEWIHEIFFSKSITVQKSSVTVYMSENTDPIVWAVQMVSERLWFKCQKEF